MRDVQSISALTFCASAWQKRPTQRSSRAAKVDGSIGGTDWCAYVINLARRPDRLARLHELLGATNPLLLQRLQRVDAVDGTNISLDSAAASNVVEPQALSRARRAKRMGLYSIVHDEDGVGQKLGNPNMACAGNLKQQLKPAVPWAFNFDPYPGEQLAEL